VKFLRHFIFRDLAFIVGGMSLLLCLNYSWPNTKTQIFGYEISIPECILIVSVAYILGYLVMDAFCIVSRRLGIKWITTSIEKQIPGKWLKKAYECWTHKEVNWANLKGYNEDKATIYINRHECEKNQAEFERMTSHLVMCMTIGLCWSIIGVFLLVHGVIVLKKETSCFGFFSLSSGSCNQFIFGLVIFATGACLVFLGALKNLRIRKFRDDLLMDLNEKQKESLT
jgi:hypothetical protein